MIALPCCKCYTYTLVYTVGRSLDAKVAPELELSTIVSAVGGGGVLGVVWVGVGVCVCVCLCVCV